MPDINAIPNIFNSPYKFSENEEILQKKWKEEKVYKYTSTEEIREEKTFSIDTPPPTISGSLHMGHIFSYCHTDFIARYKRMRGFNVFYPMGFDDNGLPTEKLVEKRYKIKANSDNIEEYLAKCRQTSAEDRDIFRMLFQKVGLSVDWNLEYNTISKECQKMSQLSFISLYERGLIYIKESPVLWDPADQTTVAQAEIEDKTEVTKMHYIDFQIYNSEEKITIATTRPELIPACCAILINPNDTRFKHLNAQHSIVPICERIVPILFDPDVLIEKGTGAVMCCTFGDEKDVEWQERYNLEKRIIINKYGRITDLDKHIPSHDKGYIERLSNLKISDARNIILEICTELKILQKQEEISHIVKVAERSGSKLEIIETKQWYIKVLGFKKELYEYSMKCNWFPSYMQNRIIQWIEGLKWDWCISRQRFSGVPIPIWYVKSTMGVVIAKQNMLPIDPRVSYPEGYETSTDDLLPCTDVLDTWATSSLTPNINAKTIYPIVPMDLRPQGHEIIRTWAFYTIVQSFLHNKSIPWNNIMLSGWCLANNKEKMSKSKGNVIEPLNLLEIFGADAIRYWASNTSLGADTVYSEETIKIGKKLINKIFNASKLIYSLLDNNNNDNANTTTISVDQGTSISMISDRIDLWIIFKLKRCISNYEEFMDKYEYNHAKNCIENFFTKDFCDNYIEIVKTRAYTKDHMNNNSAIQTLLFSLIASLKAFAPFFPYITDIIYRTIYRTILQKHDKSIHIKNNWIDLDEINHKTRTNNMLDYQLESFGDAILEILKNTREWKTNKGISIKKMIKEITVTTNNLMLSEASNDLKDCCNTENITFLLEDNANSNNKTHINSEKVNDNIQIYDISFTE